MIIPGAPRLSQTLPISMSPVSGVVTHVHPSRVKPVYRIQIVQGRRWIVICSKLARHSRYRVALLKGVARSHSS